MQRKPESTAPQPEIVETAMGHHNARDAEYIYPKLLVDVGRFSIEAMVVGRNLRTILRTSSLVRYSS